MILKTTGYAASNGLVYAKLEDAQRHELCALFPTLDGMMPEDIASAIIASKAEVLDILTTGPNSRGSARKINGAKRRSRAKAGPGPVLFANE